MDLPTEPALLLVISGPAGCGKSTLCSGMVEAYPAIQRVVTCTTRTPRDGEVNGKDYHFLTDEQFDAAVEEGAFLEWAKVHTKRYGTLKKSVFEPLEANTDLVMNIDVQGVRSFRRAADESALLARRLVTVFVMPDSMSTLEERLRGRGKDSGEEIRKRLETASHEVREWTHYDFCIRSATKETDFRQIEHIWKSEKHRVMRMKQA